MTIEWLFAFIGILVLWCELFMIRYGTRGQ